MDECHLDRLGTIEGIGPEEVFVHCPLRDMVVLEFCLLGHLNSLLLEIPTDFGFLAYVNSHFLGSTALFLQVILVPA